MRLGVRQDQALVATEKNCIGGCVICFAILRVSYEGDTGKPDMLTVDSAEHLDNKIKEVQARAKVARIGVFKCDYHIDRVERWISTPYGQTTTEQGQ